MIERLGIVDRVDVSAVAFRTEELKVARDEVEANRESIAELSRSHIFGCLVEHPLGVKLCTCRRRVAVGCSERDTRHSLVILQGHAFEGAEDFIEVR